MHAGELAEMHTLQSIAARLNDAPHSSRGAIVADGCRMLGVSAQTLYKRLRKVGFSSGRKLRSDRGDTRVGTDGVKAVAAILQASRRTTGKALLPVQDAMDVAEANGLLAERVSATTMLRIMRREGCHPTQLAQPTPHTSMRSLHPNHVWQLDASICVIYYLRNGRVGVMDERKFNERKPRDLVRVADKRVLRYAITDHFTADTIGRYYHTSGENQRTLFEFLMFAFHAWKDRVMHGVPWMMVWDAGSANTSHGIVNLLTQLGVRHWAHVPGNSRAKGQVEVTHNIIERKFEGRLTLRLSGGRNYSPHADGDIADSVSPALRSELQTEMTLTRAGAPLLGATAVSAAYAQAVNAPARATLLQLGDDLQREANRIATLWRPARKFYQLAAVLDASAADSLEPGQTVRLVWPRYGLNAGRNLFVVGVRSRFFERRVDLVLWG